MNTQIWHHAFQEVEAVLGKANPDTAEEILARTILPAMVRRRIRRRKEVGPQIKTLADLKRAITPGTRILCHENTRNPKFNGTGRTVTRVQTNGFYFISDSLPGEFWTEYYKASQFKFDGSSTFRVYAPGSAEHYVKLAILSPGVIE